MERTEKRKFSENIYIVLLLSDYLTGQIPLFRLLKKIFSINTENVLKSYKNEYYTN
jgi:hypothetical protein